MSSFAVLCGSPHSKEGVYIWGRFWRLIKLYRELYKVIPVVARCTYTVIFNKDNVNGYANTKVSFRWGCLPWLTRFLPCLCRTTSAGMQISIRSLQQNFRTSNFSSVIYNYCRKTKVFQLIKGPACMATESAQREIGANACIKFMLVVSFALIK